MTANSIRLQRRVSTSSKKISGTCVSRRAILGSVFPWSSVAQNGQCTESKSDVHLPPPLVWGRRLYGQAIEITEVFPDLNGITVAQRHVDLAAEIATLWRTMDTRGWISSGAAEEFAAMREECEETIEKSMREFVENVEWY